MIRPFAGLRLKPDLIRQGESLCLPCDCLTPELDRRLRCWDFNAIHLEEPRPTLVHGQKLWPIWKQGDCLTADPTSYYLLVEKFNGIRRIGVLGMADLTSAARTKKIWPHERHHPPFVSRRKKHFRSVCLHMSPIFLVAEDRREKLKDIFSRIVDRAKNMPEKIDLGKSVFDNVQRQLIVLSDKKLLGNLSEALRAAGGFLVADGHHRLQAALGLAEEGYLKRTMCYVTSARSTIGFLKEHPAVPIRASCIVRAPSLEEIFVKAKEGKLFPKKTTYFWPKIPCGLVYAEI